MRSAAIKERGSTDIPESHNVSAMGNSYWIKANNSKISCKKLYSTLYLVDQPKWDSTDAVLLGDHWCSSVLNLGLHKIDMAHYACACSTVAGGSLISK